MPKNNTSFNVKVETGQEVYGEILTLLRGYSPYELALKDGFVGTEEEWLASLVGEKGEVGDGIEDVVLNDDYTLTIFYTNGDQYTMPHSIRGETGATGNGIKSATLNPDYTLTLLFTDGGSYTTIPIRGLQGERGLQGIQGIQGETGNGISRVKLNSDYTLTIYFTDGTSNTTSPIRGAQGEKGETGNGIKYATMNSDYTLTIKFTDGSEYTTPVLRGAQGIQGMKGDVGNGIDSAVLNSDYTLTLNFTDGTSYTTTSIRGQAGERGEQGVQGEPGNGIAKATLNPDYTLTLSFTDGSSYTTSSIRGMQGIQGIQGANGADGVGIASAEMNQDYTLTLRFTDGTHYTTPSLRGATGSKGDKGDTGNGIDHVQLNNDYTLTLYFDDGTQYTTASIRGEKGDSGDSPTITTTKSGKRTTIYADDSPIGTVDDGADGHTPVITATKSGKITTIKADGTIIAEINDGNDGATGATGASGSDGKDGKDGADGFSPTATVSKSGSTATITITDKNGTTTAEIHDGQGGTGTIDPTPTEGSTNAVSSGGVYDELSDIMSDLSELADEIADAEADISETPIKRQTGENVDLDITDEDGNVIARIAGGHIKTKNFDSDNIKTSDLNNDAGYADAEETEAINYTLNNLPAGRTTSSSADLEFTDENGNVVAQFINGHLKTKNFDSSDVHPSMDGIVQKVNNTPPDEYGNVNVYVEADPSEIAEAVDDYLDEHPVVAAACGIVSVADYGAVGDGVTDDSAAIQNAVDANYEVYFESNKTYYLASKVTINHDIKLHGGINSVIKTKAPSTGTASANDGIEIKGTLKKTTTLTSDYLSVGANTNPNCSNQLTLASMSEVEIGDIVHIRATDQFYSYARQYYYLGGVFKVVDKYDGHIYISRNMPFDITLTTNVAVYVYSAPVAEVENLSFESDLDSFNRTGYPALLNLTYCKDSVVRQCRLKNTQIGVRASYCVNTIFDGVQVAKSRWVNTSGMGDGYGINISSCTNTIVQRYVSLSAQGCLSLGGYEPIFDTYVLRSHIASECRGVGIDMHENSYNIVVEDCVLGGVSLYGTATVNRCQFIKNNRPPGDGGCITFRGSHDPRFARLRVSHCTFDSNLSNWLNNPSAQSPIQSIDHIIDSAVFEHCRGGKLVWEVATDEFNLSNTVNNILIDDWQDCEEFYHKADQRIKNLVVKDSSFTKDTWLNNHVYDTFSTDGIDYTTIISTFPRHEYLLANVDGNGGRHLLSSGTPIEVSSSSENALYIVCKENCASNNNNDYSAGSVSGSVGAVLTRTPNSTATANISTDSNGKLKFTHPNDTTAYAIYPKCMLQATEKSKFRMSVKLKNTGNTDGDSFRAYIAVVNPETGYVTYRGNGTSEKATSTGVVIQHSQPIPKGYIVIGYLGGYNAVANAETTFEEFTMTLTPYNEPAPAYSAYSGSRRTGDGSIASYGGINHVMSDANEFHMEFYSDMVKGLY